MAESIIDYAIREQGRRQARAVLAEVLAEVDLPADARQRLLAALRRHGVG